MSAERYEIFDDGALTIAIKLGENTQYVDELEDDFVVGAIRQQARDIKLLTQMLHEQRLVIDDLEHMRVKVCDENDQLRTDLAAAVAERDELKDQMACLKEFRMDGFGVDMRWSGDAANALMSMLAQMMLDIPNYLESTLTIAGHGESYVMTIRKHDGKTPHAMRAEVEAERDTLRARLAAIENAPTLCWQDVHDPSDLYWRRPDPAQVDTRELIARPAKD